LGALEQWLIPSIVLYELVWVLKKLGLDPPRIREVVEAVLDNPKTAVVADGGAHAKEAIRALESEGLSPAHFNDKVVLAVAAELELPLATYDRELRREARGQGVAVLPAAPLSEEGPA